MLCGMWDLPGPGLEPMSPALAGGFLTTAPPGKPYRSSFDWRFKGNHSEEMIIQLKAKGYFEGYPAKFEGSMLKIRASSKTQFMKMSLVYVSVSFL